MFLCVLGLLFALLAQNTSPANPETILDQGLKVRWRDDAAGHPDLIAFRNRLMKAAKRHDVEAIIRAADPDFRGCDMRNLDDLRRFFSPDAGEEPWADFHESLTEGGVLSQGATLFESNYAGWLFPTEKTGTIGPEYFSVIKGANVPVYENPALAAKVLARLSYNVVIPENAVVDRRWQRIEFLRGQFGFVLSKNLIDPIGMSVDMQKRKGRWRLTGITLYCD